MPLRPIPPPLSGHVFMTTNMNERPPGQTKKTCDELQEDGVPVLKVIECNPMPREEMQHCAVRTFFLHREAVAEDTYFRYGNSDGGRFGSVTCRFAIPKQVPAEVEKEMQEWLEKAPLPPSLAPVPPSPTPSVIASDCSTPKIISQARFPHEHLFTPTTPRPLVSAAVSHAQHRSIAGLSTNLQAANIVTALLEDVSRGGHSDDLVARLQTDLTTILALLRVPDIRTPAALTLPLFGQGGDTSISGYPWSTPNIRVQKSPYVFLESLPVSSDGITPTLLPPAKGSSPGSYHWDSDFPSSFFATSPCVAPLASSTSSSASISSSSHSSTSSFDSSALFKSSSSASVSSSSSKLSAALLLPPIELSASFHCSSTSDHDDESNAESESESESAFASDNASDDSSSIDEHLEVEFQFDLDSASNADFGPQLMPVTWSPSASDACYEDNDNEWTADLDPATSPFSAVSTAVSSRSSHNNTYASSLFQITGLDDMVGPLFVERIEQPSSPIRSAIPDPSPRHHSMSVTPMETPVRLPMRRGTISPITPSLAPVMKRRRLSYDYYESEYSSS